MSQAMTVAPRSAAFNAILRPIPPAAPVTRTFLPGNAVMTALPPGLSGAPLARSLVINKEATPSNRGLCHDVAGGARRVAGATLSGRSGHRYVDHVAAQDAAEVAERS